MTYDHEIVLLRETTVDDGMGGRKPGVTRRTPILAQVKSVSRNEYYQAHEAGLRPEIVFVVHDCEYHGQSAIEHQGKRYRVIRTYQGNMARQGQRLSFDEMELVCEEWSR